VATLNWIYREERPGFQGWVVKVRREKRESLRYFNDVPQGPVESMRRAIAYRDQLLQRLGAPTHMDRKHRGNKSGVLGVCREIYKTSSGGIGENCVASWVDEARRRHRRAFSIQKYGEDEANARATAARRKGVQESLAARHRLMLETFAVRNRFKYPERARPDNRQPMSKTP
jgi:AP2 domain